MALFKEIKCGRCDRRYSAIRSKCPYCGAKKNYDGKKSSTTDNSKLQIFVGLFVLIAIIIGVVILITSSLKGKPGEEQPGGTNPPPTQPGLSSVPAPPSASPSADPVTPPPPPSPTPLATPEPIVNSITLNRSDFTLSKIGETFRVAATISPAGSKAELIWISEDPDVATVSEDGTVTAVNHGTTIVSATAGGVTTECIVRVTAYAPSTGGSTGGSGDSGSVRLSHSDVTIHSGNSETFRLKVSGAPDGSTVTYASSNSGVASVESGGTVKAVSNGTATITVTITGTDGKTDELKCVVRVVN